MPPQYENYVWRLQAPIITLDLQLPQDLEWIDEFSWNPIKQSVDYTLTGALVIQENVQSRGRPITLQGKDDMGWIPRTVGEELMRAKDTPALTMNLQYVDYSNSVYGTALVSYDVMFRHYEPPVLELESVLRYDNFEPTAWFKVRNIKFMETLASSTSPCTANVTLTVSNVSGTFQVGEVITGGTSSTSGTLLSISSNVLNLYVSSGNFQVNEQITGGTSGATADIDSIA